MHSQVDPKTGDSPDRTVRYPWVDDPSGNNKLIKSMQDWYLDPSEKDTTTPNPYRNLTERLCYVLLSNKYFGSMSNNAYRGSDPDFPTEHADTWASLEGTLSDVWRKHELISISSNASS